ncbi:hypothetical protein PIB30_041824 [Stylosanthes scabra]|uniref:Uncharacterized protein n=1 Tax=Stylosanthes scabra TaxID=79078 RepID=A0ABU6QEF5_9FABA|nr:hypothetical protein [Stylosanthes scabra]
MSPHTALILAFSIVLSLPVIFILGPTVLIQSHLQLPFSPQDELDDLSLFTLASTFRHHVPPKPKPSRIFQFSYQTKPNPKIAFLFLTNTDIHFSPLWNLFFHDQPTKLYNIYIHKDPSVNLTRPVEGVFKNRFIPSKKTARASPILISAARRLLAHALLNDPENAYFALLSQHCIPLHSFPYVYRSLFFSPTFNSPKSTRQTQTLIHRSYIEILTHAPRLWNRYIARGRFAMLPEVKFDDFRVGSQFFTLTRSHALLVIKDRALWRKFRSPCYKMDECYPEEHYFPTLLSMMDPEGCTNYTLTNVNWTGTKGGHPYSYKPQEVSVELISRLRESNFSESYLFARKFTPDCLQPLLYIAEMVIFKD